jgi:hypothetical protein
MQREIAELNRLKQNKNRKYSWPGQLAVYSQPVEVTLYLTLYLFYLGVIYRKCLLQELVQLKTNRWSIFKGYILIKLQVEASQLQFIIMVVSKLSTGNHTSLLLGNLRDTYSLTQRNSSVNVAEQIRLSIQRSIVGLTSTYPSKVSIY